MEVNEPKSQQQRKPTKPKFFDTYLARLNDKIVRTETIMNERWTSVQILKPSIGGCNFMPMNLTI